MINACAKPIGLGLHGITDGNAEIAAVAEQAFDEALPSGGNDQNIADSCQHQYGQGIVNRWACRIRAAAV